MTASLEVAPQSITNIAMPEVQAWVVVDSLHEYTAMGGTRLTTTVTQKEVRELARGMSQKLALIDLPIGGAKAGVVRSDASSQDTLRAFGRAVSPLLRGGVHLGCDMGVSPADRRCFSTAAEYDVRIHVPRYNLRVSWEEYWAPLLDVTGFGVVTAVETVAAHLPVAAPLRIAIQGFGMVGRGAATTLALRGSRIVGVSDERGYISAESGIDVSRLIKATSEHGIVDRTRLPAGVRVDDDLDACLRAEVDVLILAANAYAVNDTNAEDVAARVVVEGGNICCSRTAKALLRNKGVLVVPDVIASAGGAAVGGCALTGTLPSDLDAVGRRAWLFEWIATRITRNTTELLELLDAGDPDPVLTMLHSRRTSP